MLKLIASLALFVSFSITTPAGAAGYGIPAGGKAPTFSTRDIFGKEFEMSKVARSGDVVLVFYRGRWCPFCNRQLHEIEEKLVPAAAKVHATVVAISVDLPKEGLKTRKMNSLTFRILSDPEARILGLYNVRYHVQDELVAKYKDEYHLDLEAASGNKSHVIAVPSVYVIKKGGLIRYAYVNEDYKVRAPIADIEAALD